MKKLVPLFLCTFILLSCSTDALNPMEDASADTIDNLEVNSDTQESTEIDPVEPIVEENTDDYFVDSFDTDGPLVDYVTNNASALPNVSSVSGRYTAVLDDNTNNITLHFHRDQGRIDAKLVTFPFEFIARNIGIGTLSDSQTAPSPNGNPYLF